MDEKALVLNNKVASRLLELPVDDNAIENIEEPDEFVFLAIAKRSFTYLLSFREFWRRSEAEFWQKNEHYYAFMASLGHRTFKDALLSKDRIKWWEAYRDELHKLASIGGLVIVKRPTNLKTLPILEVLTKKVDNISKLPKN